MESSVAVDLVAEQHVLVQKI